MNKQYFIGFFLLIGIILLVGCSEENGVIDNVKGTLQMDEFDEEDLIETAKNAILEFDLNAWGNGLTVGEAFSNFFSTTEWKCTEFTQGEEPGSANGIVEFTGDMISPSTGIVTNVNMKFRVYEGDEYVGIAAIAYDGNPLYNDPLLHSSEIKSLVNRIYDQVYYPEEFEQAKQQATEQSTEQSIDESYDYSDGEGFYTYYEPAFKNTNSLEEQLRNGLDPNSTYEYGQTLLTDSINMNNIEAVTILLEYGADPNFDFEGFTPLIVAAEQGHKSILISLIEAGADVNKIGSSTPLIRAIMNEHIEIVDELIKRGADVNLTPPDSYSPLNLAEYQGNSEIIHLLQQEGAESF